MHLAWEVVNEDVVTGFCKSWRVLALAIRKIMPLEQLIRAAPSEEQFALRQSCQLGVKFRDKKEHILVGS